MYWAQAATARRWNTSSRSSRREPANAIALGGLANALFQLGRLDEAEQAAQRARAADPAQSAAYNVLGQIHTVRARFGGAPRRIRFRGQLQRTESRPLLGALMHLQHRMCGTRPRWRASWARVAPELDSHADFGSPFVLLGEPTTAAQRLGYSRRWAATRFGSHSPEPPPPHAASRAGAFAWAISLRTSRSTRTAYLLAEVLELHDREALRDLRVVPWTRRLEPDARAHSQCRRSVFRRCRMGSRQRGRGPDARRRARCARRSEGPYRRASARGHGEASLRGASGMARLSRHDGRAIHRLHHCGSPGPFRPMPRSTIPSACCACRTAIRRTTASARSESRARARSTSLPESGFVFCCFNQSVKITTDVFERWINLLLRVEGSVLWLAEDNEWASANSIEQARLRGIGAERIV